MLSLIGEDPDREGLADTPARWVKAMLEQSEGLKRTASDELSTTFSDDCDEMVVVLAVPFVSLCEHHLLPFTGTAAIGYLPDGRIVGLSKLPRLLHCLARRPQVQERLTTEVADIIDDVLHPRGAGVRLRAHHSCMSCRGVRSAGEMVTQELRGLMRTDTQVRAEFLALVNGH